MDFDSDAFNQTLFFPRAIASETPVGAHDHFVDVDGAALHLRVHDAGAAGAAGVTVLFFHGNGEVVADYDHAARSFAEAGARLAVVDYRGYGQSTGTPTLRSIIVDAHDVLACTLRLVEGGVVVMGRSIGSACANELYARAQGLDERVRGFVLESGFTSIPRLAERRNMRAPAQVEPIFDPIAKLRRGVHPLLILHGARDSLVRPDEADAAFAAAGSGDKELVMLAGRGHNDISMTPEYWTNLASFIRRVAR
jgi:pimeloyl-ACP methyl ester carboxylesterase